MPYHAGMHTESASPAPRSRRLHSDLDPPGIRAWLENHLETGDAVHIESQLGLQTKAARRDIMGRLLGDGGRW